MRATIRLDFRVDANIIGSAIVFANERACLANPEGVKQALTEIGALHRGRAMELTRELLTARGYYHEGIGEDTAPEVVEAAERRAVELFPEFPGP